MTAMKILIARRELMDGQYTVTVKVWKNGDELETYVDSLQRAAHLNTGHAALKLQQKGAGKGEYLYLSFWPNEQDQPAQGFSAKSYHSMTARYGKSTTVPQPFALPTAKVQTSDKVVMENKSADETYYLNGPDYDKMATFIRQLSVIPTRDDKSGVFKGDQKLALETGKWRLSKRNCAHAVYECLRAGGAPEAKIKTEMTPNRLSTYCQELVVHYGGDCKKK